MAKNKYAYNKEVDEAKTARAMAKSLKISQSTVLKFAVQLEEWN